MKIGILSFVPLSNKRSYSGEIRLKEEALKKGHKVKILRKDKFVMTLEGNGLNLMYNNKPFRGYDVIVSRVSISKDVIIQASILEQLQLMGTPVINRYYPVVQAKNKLHSLQILSAAGMPIVKTAMIFGAQYLEEGLKRINSFPIIVKTPYGSHGNGVTVFESRRSIKSAYGIFFNSSPALIQEYVKESKGKDIRIIVVGGEVLAAMERKAKKGEFRSNMHRGGKGKKIKPTEELKNLAIRATKALNLDYSGVDIIITKSGPAVVEVNANPGLGIEEVTGVNVAKQIILYAEKFVNQHIDPVENIYQ